MRVLVCGGRTYNNAKLIGEELDKLLAEYPDLIVIHGGASGADWLAKEWCRTKWDKVDCFSFPAKFKRHGKRQAGRIRNLRMILEGKPTLVLAFPGGDGTANMVKQAIEYRIEVRHVPDPEWHRS